MTNSELFLQILHRLKNYDDAAVLYTCLTQHADVEEFRTSATRMGLDLLEGQLGRRQVQHSLNRLSDLGLLSKRAHPNYRTLIQIDRDTILVFLRSPLSPRLPGVEERSFPFIRSLQEARNATDQAIGKARRDKPNTPPTDSTDPKE